MAILFECRAAFRRLSRRRTLGVALTSALAFGIGTSTAAFSVLDAVVLHPYNWRSPDSLVAIYSVRLDKRSDPEWARTWNTRGFSWQVWHELQDSAFLAQVAGWCNEPQVVLGPDRTAILSALGVSSNLFPLLGVRIVEGRGFSQGEDREPSDSILISEETWRTRFGSRRDIAGTRVAVSRYLSSDAAETRTVIGVVAARFRLYGESPDVLLPIGHRARTSTWSLKLVARTAPTASVSALQAAVASIAKASGAPWPVGARVVPLASDHAGDRATALWLLFAFGVLLLAVSAVNVANLLLAEAEARRRELSLRLALGASFKDLLSQMTAELTLVGVVSVCFGIVIAGWFTSLIVARAPAGLPELEGFRLGWRSIFFSCGVGGLALASAGISPLLFLRFSRAAAISTGGADVMGNSGSRHQRIVILIQVTAAMVMAVVAGLLAENVRRLEDRPLGFDAENLLVVHVQSPDTQSQRTDPMIRGVLERVRTVPGVLSVGSVTAAPLSGQGVEVGVRLESGEASRVLRHFVSPDYFRTMSMRPIEGRLLSSVDHDTNAAVVSESFARAFLGGRVLGSRITEADGRSLAVIGSVCDVRERSQADELRPTYYVLGGAAYGLTTFVVRSSPGAVNPTAVRSAIVSVWPTGVVTQLEAMDDVLERSFGDHRFRRTLAVLFGLATVVLSLLGLHSLMTRRVVQRRRELGIRAALGASPSRIAAFIFLEALVVGGAGAILGLVISAAVAHVMRALLVTVSPTEPVIYALAALGVNLAVIGAVLGPVAAAWHLDAVTVLRE